MAQKQLSTIYNTVCDALGNEVFLIDYLPEMFEYSTIDDSKPHVHTFYEIIWFQEKGGTHSVDFRNYDVEDNSMFFLSPGQVHCFDGRTRHKGIAMKFCTDFMKEENDDENIFIKYNVFNTLDSSPYCIINNEQVIDDLKGLINKMQEEQKNDKDFGHLELLRSLVKIFLINIHRHGKRKGSMPLDMMKSSHRLFVMFRKMLEQNYTQLHLVQDYANKLNVSTKTLSNSVIECANKAPLTFINDRILLEAKRLLRFTDLMVKEIAYRLGYDDPSYFVKFFKRQAGILPSDFRTINSAKQQMETFNIDFNR
jgi:AraC family transcriptional activator of pobA